MKKISYLILLAAMFTACRSVRSTTATETLGQPMIAGVISPSANNIAATTEPAPVANEAVITETTLAEPTTEQAIAQTQTKAAPKKASSFKQLKEMARSGEIVMSKKDLKILNKLDKGFTDNAKRYRDDSFEFTTKAKIVAGIGLFGLLLAIFTGSGFGWFLFILAAIAFLLRYLDVIAF